MADYMAEQTGIRVTAETVRAHLKAADIVISRTDPLANIRSLENVDNIVVVMKDGQVVKDIR